MCYVSRQKHEKGHIAPLPNHFRSMSSRATPPRDCKMSPGERADRYKQFVEACLSRSETKAQYIARIQNTLAIRAVLTLYEKYRTMKKLSRDEEIKANFNDYVNAVELPLGYTYAMLKIPARSDEALNDTKIYKKAKSIAADIVKEYNPLWLSLFPNGLPSGASVYEAKAKFVIEWHR